MLTRIRYLLLILTTLAACKDPAPIQEDSLVEEIVEKKFSDLLSDDVEIIEIEGCEYIVLKHTEGSNKGYGFMAHKGNCKNPIHCYNLPKSDSNRVDTTKLK